MIDPAMVDALFEQSQVTGKRFRFALFDKRVLLPMSQLPAAVKAETQEEISLSELETMASQGWFPVLSSPDVNGERGVPLYVPSRVGLFRSLERDGWSPNELRLIACSQEWKIDNLLAAEELAYTDDDLETLVLFTRARIDALQDGTHVDGQGKDQDEELASEREQLEVFETMQRSGIPAHLTPGVTKDVFRVRAMNDVMRMWLLDVDEARLRAGYGPMIGFSSSSSGPQGFEGGKIDWDWTVRAAMADADPVDEPPLRVPGFLLRGVQVATTRTFRPADYGAAWRKYDIDGYLATWAKLHNERRCLNCFTSLSADADDRRFCNAKCRNAVKQRRHREQNPESVERAQAKYWRSLGPANDEANGS